MTEPLIPRCGDSVRHRSGEVWFVAWVEGDDIAWAGWPNGMARLADCELTYRCTDDEHVKAVREWEKVTDDSRAARVRRLYGAP